MASLKVATKYLWPLVTIWDSGAMKMAKSCKEGTAANQRGSGLEGSQVQNLVPARTFRFGISVKMYPSSSDLQTQYQFMCEMY